MDERAFIVSDFKASWLLKAAHAVIPSLKSGASFEIRC